MTVGPGIRRAGSWKHRDLPVPVGRIPSVSRPRQHLFDDLALPGTQPGHPEPFPGFTAQA